MMVPRKNWMDTCLVYERTSFFWFERIRQKMNMYCMNLSKDRLLISDMFTVFFAKSNITALQHTAWLNHRWGSLLLHFRALMLTFGMNRFQLSEIGQFRGFDLQRFWEGGRSEGWQDRGRDDDVGFSMSPAMDIFEHRALEVLNSRYRYIDQESEQIKKQLFA